MSFYNCDFSALNVYLDFLVFEHSFEGQKMSPHHIDSCEPLVRGKNSMKYIFPICYKREAILVCGVFFVETKKIGTFLEFFYLLASIAAALLKTTLRPFESLMGRAKM
jgi:hypothetical protein